MSDQDRTILARFRQRLTQGLSLYRVILFGSRARGDADEYSDMDVLVILNEPVDDRKRRLVSRAAWEAGFEQSIVVVPITVSREEWEEGPERSSLLAIAVAEEGITV